MESLTHRLDWLDVRPFVRIAAQLIKCDAFTMIRCEGSLYTCRDSARRRAPDFTPLIPKLSFLQLISAAVRCWRRSHDESKSDGKAQLNKKTLDTISHYLKVRHLSQSCEAVFSLRRG